MAQTLAHQAEALEARALTDPHLHDDYLLQAAAVWARTGHGQHIRSQQICTTLIEQGSKLTRAARLQLLELHLEHDERDLARAQLAALAEEPSLTTLDCAGAAELLDTHHDLPAAADWYDHAAARLTDEQLDAVRNDTAPGAETATMLSDRQDVRQRLGKAPDDLDRLVTDEDEDDEELKAALATIDKIFGHRPAP